MIFITGATGFLGSYLARKLVRDGFKIRALKRTHSNFDLLGDSATAIEWVEGDLLDVTSLENALDGIDKIYHCAGLISTGSKRQHQAAIVNTEGTANLFNTALTKGVKKVLHVSSTMAFGIPINGAIIDENTYVPVVKSRSSYLESKRFGELEAWRAHAEGLDVVIVNPGGIIGAGHWNHEPLNAISAVDNGLNFYTEGMNGFIDVRDTVNIMIQLMESEISGERFILISENVALKDLLFMIADELHLARPKYKAGKFLSSLAWRYEFLKSLVLRTEPLFTKEDIRIAGMSFRYNNAGIIKATGYRFKPIAETMHDAVQSYLESKKKGLGFAIFNL